MNRRIQITITGTNGPEVHTIDVAGEMPEHGELLIDRGEQEVLQLNRDAIRAAIVVYVEELVKKKPARRKELMAELSRLMPDHTPSTEK